VPILLRHRHEAGQAEPRIDRGRLLASGVLRTDGVAGELIVNARRLGRAWGCSLRTEQGIAFQAPGGDFNGRRFTGSIVLLCDAVLREVTITENPAGTGPAVKFR
jgi:hypothetical protein